MSEKTLKFNLEENGIFTVSYYRLEKEMQTMQESLMQGRRTSEPVKLNNFSKSETVLNKFAATTNGVAANDLKHRAQQANTVQTLVVGTTTATAASPPKGNGFCLTGPVTDL